MKTRLFLTLSSLLPKPLTRGELLALTSVWLQTANSSFSQKTAKPRLSAYLNASRPANIVKTFRVKETRFSFMVRLKRSIQPTVTLGPKPWTLMATPTTIGLVAQALARFLLMALLR